MLSGNWRVKTNREGHAREIYFIAENGNSRISKPTGETASSVSRGYCGMGFLKGREVAARLTRSFFFSPQSIFRVSAVAAIIIIYLCKSENMHAILIFLEKNQKERKNADDILLF